MDMHPEALVKAFDAQFERSRRGPTAQNMNEFLVKLLLENFPAAAYEKKSEFTLRVTKKPFHPNEPAIHTLEFPARAPELAALVRVVDLQRKKLEGEVL